MEVIYHRGGGLDHLVPQTTPSSSSSSSKERMSGELKQQCLDENNMYEWIRKKICLRVQEGVLEISLPSVTQEQEEMMKKESSQVSLGGAKEAKAWSSTTSQVGFGFDLIWSSGNMWSFLADDELSCLSWVKAINEAIQCSTAMAEVHRAVDVTVSKSQEDLRGTILRGGANSVKSMGVATTGTANNYDNPLLPPRPPSGQGLGLGQGQGQRLNDSDCITVEEDFQSPLRFTATREGGGGGAVYSGERTMPR